MNKLENWFDNLFSDDGWLGHRPSYTLTHPWKGIEHIGYDIKYAYQRVVRGYDDRVSWSIDYYLNKNMPLWLKELKSAKGTPCSFCLDCYETSNRKEWEEVLDKMILGFESAEKMDNVYNEEELNELDKQFQEGMALFVKYYHALWS